MKEKNNTHKIISFIFPLIGLIIYAVNVSKNDKLAKECLKWALIGMAIVPTIIIILWFAYKIRVNNTLNLYNKQTIVEKIDVKVLYNEEEYIIENVPKSIEIELTGKESDINLLKKNDKYYVTLDLSNYYVENEEEKEIPYIFDIPIKGVKYNLKEKFANITIKAKNSVISKFIVFKYIDENSVKESISNISVVLTGTKTSIEKVDKVIGTFKKGTTDEKVMLYAYDKNDNIIEDVEIVPNSVDLKKLD